jgi:hypothetical protein
MATAAAVQKKSGLTAVRTHKLDPLSVTYGRPWVETVQAAGPNTYEDSDVWKVGDLYPTTLQGVVVVDGITLYNFGKYVESEDVETFFEEEGMETVNPHEVLAVAEKNPTLHTTLGLDYMGAVSLQKCSFEGGSRVVCAWFDGSGRGGGLSWFGGGWGSDVWFAAKPKAQQAQV